MPATSTAHTPAFAPPRRGAPPSALDQYLADVARYPRMTREEERDAGRAARAGDESAFQRLVTANLYFAVYHVRRYRNRGLPVEDLIQEANVALVAAARAFDPERGTKLISLAVRAIDRRVNDAITQQARVVTVPPGRAPDMLRVSRAQTRLTGLLSRAPTVEEVARETALAPSTVETILQVTAPPLRVDSGERPAVQTGRGGMSTTDHPLERIEGEERSRWVARAVAGLSGSDAEVIRRAFGFAGPTEEAETLEDIAASRGVSKQAVHQVKRKALERLRPALAAVAP